MRHNPFCDRDLQTLPRRDTQHDPWFAKLFESPHRCLITAGALLTCNGECTQFQLVRRGPCSGRRVQIELLRVKSCALHSFVPPWDPSLQGRLLPFKYFRERMCSD